MKPKLRSPSVICVTGAESSGKSTLCKHLCDHYDCTYQDEYARAYLADRPLEYGFDDLKAIARTQLAQQKKIIAQSNSIAIIDTDLVNLVVWSKMKFDQDIANHLDDNDLQWSDYYLVCAPDIPWKADPLRESPNLREEIFNAHISLLQSKNLPYTVIRGSETERFDTARSKLDSLIKAL